MKTYYKIFANGRHICTKERTSETTYSEIFQRAIGIAMYLGISGTENFTTTGGWYNPKSKNIIDKWKGTVNGEERQVIITMYNEE